MKLYNSTKKNFFRHRRAISPIIAVIMLIGITVLGGALVFTTVYTVMTTESPLEISFDTPTNYETTEKELSKVDRFIDSFYIQITNLISEPVVFDFTNYFVYNATDNLPLDDWYVANYDDEVVVQGKESLVLNLKTNADYNYDELSAGDQFYVQCAVRKVDDSNAELFKSDIFIVSPTNSRPSFSIAPVGNAYQSNEILYFPHFDPVTRNLTFAIFNLGNTEESYSVSAILTFENTTLFTTTTYVKVINIPSSTIANYDSVCSTGEACSNVSIPITRNNLTNDKDSYSVYVSAGTASYSFSLTIADLPEYFISMPNSNILFSLFSDTYQQGGALHFYPRLSFWGDQTDEDVTGTLSLILWNNGSIDETTSVTLEIIGLNTTVFGIDSSPSNPFIIDDGTQYLTSMPGYDYEWPSFSGDPYANSLAEWEIIRYAMDPNLSYQNQYDIIINMRDSSTSILLASFEVTLLTEVP